MPDDKNGGAISTVSEMSVPLSVGSMTKEQLDLEIQKGMDDIEAGRVIPADEVEEEMRRMYGI